MSRRSGAAALALGLSLSCSADESPQHDRRAGDQGPPAPSNLPPPSVRPEIPEVGSLDRDGNRVDDLLDREAADIRNQLGDGAAPPARASAKARLDERVRVEAVFARPITTSELETFARAGGEVRHVFRAVSYGFLGTLPRSAIEPTARALGPNLLLLESHRRIERHLDEATRTGRVRSVWASGFAGTSGLSGSATINIAILDTGVDATHPDLAGRMVGWKDYTTDATTTPIDVAGHGSHVAGIALGSGAAFGVGPGPLRYTDSRDLSSFASGTWDENPIHLPATFLFKSTATWLGGGEASLSLMQQADGATGAYTSFSSTSSGAAPLALSFNGTKPGNVRFSVALSQNAPRQVGRYAVTNEVTDYPSAGDDFPTFRGVAARSGWFGAKIFPAVGPATTAEIGAAMDDVIVQREALHIKIVNASFGIADGGDDPILRAKANTIVKNGVVFVASAGNAGSTGTIGDPARAAGAIAVGASNDENSLTQYTSAGLPNIGADVDLKPDLLAPGGSAYRSKILSVDSNSADANAASFADVRADDYTSDMGTSMAAPFVSGSAALLIQALEQSGTTWRFDSSDSPLLVKALLLASATETNAHRELSTGNPILGRSVSQKDRFEGYGILNPDAAIEAVTLAYDGAAFSDSTAGLATDRRAWGRKMSLPAGRALKLALDVPSGADFDVYVYAGADAKGNPSLVASSDNPGLGDDELLTWRNTTTTTATDAYVFVKLVSGSGSFVLTGSTFACGDGVLEPGEECDDANSLDGDCCSSTCQLDPTGKSCSDGNACTQGDLCDDKGTCVSGTPVECVPPNECNIVACVPAVGCLASPKSYGTPCAGGYCVGGSCSGPGEDITDDGEPDSTTERSRSPLPSADGSTALEPVDLSAGGSGCACALAASHDGRPSSTTTRLALVSVVVLASALTGRRRSRRHRCSR